MEPIVLIIGLALRIVGTIVCINKAKQLNRDTTGWGIFGFFLPLVAMIWIQFMKPIIVWDKNVDMDKKSDV